MVLEEGNTDFGSSLQPLPHPRDHTLVYLSGMFNSHSLICTESSQGILLDLPRNLILLYLKLVSAFSVLYPLCSLIFLLAFDVFLSVSLFLLQFLRFLTC